MGTGTSSLPSERENGSGAIPAKPGTDGSSGDGHDELRNLLVKNVMLMLGGGLVIIVGVIANSGRISSDTGNDLTEAGFKTQKRNACITDLRNESDYQRGEVQAAVLNRLAVLDGTNPETGEPLPRYINEEGETVIDADTQGELAAEYVQRGIEARERSLVAAKKLLQPTLNELCGEPVTEKNDVEN